MSDNGYSASGQFFVDNMTPFLAPWLFGSTLDFILQGVIFCQIVNYFTNFAYSDLPHFKALVVLLGVLTTLKSMHAFLILYMQFVVYFGDVETSAWLRNTSWYMIMQPLATATVGVIVQVFFTIRLYLFRRKCYVIGPLILSISVAYASAIVVTYYIAQNNPDQISTWYIPHFGGVFITDTLITGALAYHLLRHTSVVAITSSTLVSGLTKLTFQTAAPPAICALIDFSLTRLNRPAKFWHLVFNFTLCKLYAISCLWTLNARTEIRAAQDAADAMITLSLATTRREGGPQSPTALPNQTEILVKTDVVYHSTDDITDDAAGTAPVKIGPFSTSSIASRKARYDDEDARGGL